MDLVSLDVVKDDLLGERGTLNREKYELEMSLEKVGWKIRQIRREKDLTQQELGELIGVKKAQVSKIENANQNITLETMLKVFEALGSKVRISIDAE